MTDSTILNLCRATGSSDAAILVGAALSHQLAQGEGCSFVWAVKDIERETALRRRSQLSARHRAKELGLLVWHAERGQRTEYILNLDMVRELAPFVTCVPEIQCAGEDMPVRAESIPLPPAVENSAGENEQVRAESSHPTPHFGISAGEDSEVRAIRVHPVPTTQNQSAGEETAISVEWARFCPTSPTLPAQKNPPPVPPYLEKENYIKAQEYSSRQVQSNTIAESDAGVADALPATPQIQDSEQPQATRHKPPLPPAPAEQRRVVGTLRAAGLDAWLASFAARTYTASRIGQYIDRVKELRSEGRCDSPARMLAKLLRTGGDIPADHQALASLASDFWGVENPAVFRPARKGETFASRLEHFANLLATGDSPCALMS